MAFKGFGVSEESDQCLEDKLQNLASKMFQRFTSEIEDATYDYFSDVFTPTTEDQLDELYRYFVAYGKRRVLEPDGRCFPLYIVAKHIINNDIEGSQKEERSHVHVIHGCNRGVCRSCRCGWRQKQKSKSRKRFYRKVQLNSKSASDWYKILQYCFARGGKYTFVIVGGRVQKIQIGDEAVEQLRTGIDSGEGALEDGEGESCGHVRRKRSHNETTETDAGGSGENNATKRGRGVKGNAFEIEQIMKMYPCYPISNITKTQEWLQDPKLRYIDESDISYKKASKAFLNTLVNYKFQDYILLYNTSKPKFACATGELLDYYYDIDETRKIIGNLLAYQFNDDNHDIQVFLTDLYNILEKKIPKLNTLLIQSAPSAGKNYFIDMILAYYNNVGAFGIMNKLNGFGFQDGVDRRVNFWDEPNYEPCVLEMLKKICGGNDCKVRVKCVADGVINRTPLIILTNKTICLQNHPAFKDRVIQYRWRSCPMLKNYDKLPHPLYTQFLFNDYKIKCD